MMQYFSIVLQHQVVQQNRNDNDTALLYSIAVLSITTK